MKELPIEEKAKAYDKVVESAKMEKEKSRNLGLLEFIDENFPELKETEDEKMLRRIINIIDEYSANHHIDNTGCIDWLERQGLHANFRNQIQVGDTVTRNEDGVLVNLSQLKRVDKKDEKQGEQKHCNDNFPSFDEAQGTIVVEKQGEQKHWDSVKPVSEEDKLYLIPDEKTPAWSEEDETMINEVILDLELLKSKDSGEEGKAAYQREIDWLKSIKDRYTWKPSDEDILLLERIANGKSNPQDFQASLGGLIGELKKLREEYKNYMERE